MTLQEYADKVVAEQYRQPLQTLDEALVSIGWEPEQDPPECCGEPVQVRSFVGLPYNGECSTCGRFVASVDGPQWGNGHVRIIEREKFPADTDWDRIWIAGIRDPEETS